MGNCLPLNNSDGLALLRENESVPNQDFQHIEDEQIQPQMYSEFAQAVLYPASSLNQSRTLFSEEEEAKIAKRIGLIQHLPMGTYNGSKKSPECVICMIEFCVDEPVRFLPCMHIYHVRCIDDWLMRSLTCPSCMEPVDAALLNSYETS